MLRVRFSADTGTTVLYSVERASDGLWYDFGDGTFKASPATRTAAMAEGTGDLVGRFAANPSTPANVWTQGGYFVHYHVGGAVVDVAPASVITGDDRPDRLASDALDAIVVEIGVNARQSLSAILAASAGVVAGAGTGTVVIKGGSVTTTRITATTDAAGNRTGITLTLPA